MEMIYKVPILIPVQCTGLTILFLYPFPDKPEVMPNFQNKANFQPADGLSKYHKVQIHNSV